MTILYRDGHKSTQFYQIREDGKNYYIKSFFGTEEKMYPLHSEQQVSQAFVTSLIFYNNLVMVKEIVF